MKTIIALLVCVILGVVGATAQQKFVAKGNNITAVAADSSKTKATAKPVDTGLTYTDTKGVQHKVLRGPKGGYYYINKSGKRTSLPKEAREWCKKNDKSK